MFSDDDPISGGQKIALARLLKPYADKRPMRLYITSQLIGREITSSNELTLGEWRKIRDSAYPHWRDNIDNPDWTVGREFKAKVAGLAEKYLEDVLGQKRLF